MLPVLYEMKTSALTYLQVLRRLKSSLPVPFVDVVFLDRNRPTEWFYLTTERQVASSNISHLSANDVLQSFLSNLYR